MDDVNFNLGYWYCIKEYINGNSNSLDLRKQFINDTLILTKQQKEDALCFAFSFVE